MDPDGYLHQLIDGWEATGIPEGDPDTSHIPVIALTAHALVSDPAGATEAGGEGYLAKPMEKRVLEEVRRWLEPGPR